MKNQFNDVSQVWTALDCGKTVNWCHEGYRVYIESVTPGNAYQETHYTRRGDCLLSIRCIENYFGSIMSVEELPNLFTKE